jgi:hypothetical protein
VNPLVHFFSMDYELAQGLLLVELAWRWHGHKLTGKRETMYGMNHELTRVETIAQIFAAGAPFLPVAASVEPGLVSLDVTRTGTKAEDLALADRAILAKALHCIRAARRDERKGFPCTAAMEWRHATELFAPNARAVEYCWCEWERIMQLPRRLAGPPSFSASAEMSLIH